MKINCLSCGFTIDLDESYGEYEGAIKCYACEAMLEVKLTEERVKSVKLLEQTGETPGADRPRRR